MLNIIVSFFFIAVSLTCLKYCPVYQFGNVEKRELYITTS